MRAKLKPNPHLKSFYFNRKMNERKSTRVLYFMEDIFVLMFIMNNVNIKMSFTVNALLRIPTRVASL
jgi:hypothetical protein